MDPTDPAPPPADASPTPAPGQAMDRRIARPRRPGRRLALIGLGAVLVLAVALGTVRLIPPPGSLAVQAGDLQIAAVTRAPFHDYLPVRAEVAPLHTDYVAAVVGGQVVSVAVQDGVQVTAGQLLATLSNPQLKLDVVSKEAEIAGQLGSAQGQALTLESNGLDRAKQQAETDHDLLKAEHDLDVRKQLQAQGFVSPAEVKTYQAEADYYRTRLAALKAGGAAETTTAGAQAALIRQTAARLNGNLAAEQASLDALNLRAPVAGRLTDFTLEPGQTLKPGDPVGQVDSEGAYKLTADVDEYYLGRVAVGQPATADLDGASLALTVSRVLPQVTEGHFRAELTFNRTPPTGLRRGEGVDVRIVLGATQDALTLPNAGWLEGGGGSSVFVVAPGGARADRRSVTVGRRNPEQVEITSGLRPGERAVVSSYAGFDKFDHLILKGNPP